MIENEAIALPRLVELATDLLRRQREALIRGDVSRIERLGETLAKVLTNLCERLRREPGNREVLQRLRHEMHVNRLLLENGLAATDRFVTMLAWSPEVKSILLSEQV